MSKWMSGALKCAVVVGLTTACGGDGGSSTAEAPPVRSDDPFCQAVYADMDAYMASVASERGQGERYGGTVVVGAPAEILGGMGSLISPDYAANQHHMFVNLMPLIRYNADLGPEPYLARSWDLSEDGTELTFHIRDDVYWHDGTQTTAEDVAFTMRRAMDPGTGYPNDAFFTFYDKSPESVAVLDPFTVRIRLTPHNEFMDVWRSVSILPAHLLESVPPAELRNHPFNAQCPVGNGPFVFREHIAGDRWVFDANPGFPEGAGGQPYIDRYVYRIIPEQTTLQSELLTEGIDVYLAPLPDQLAQIEEAEHLRVLQFQFRNYLLVAWNNRLEKLSDRRVRQALTYATDRARILEVLRLGTGTISNGPIAPYHWAYDPTMESLYPYDPGKARALLAEAGWSDRDGDGYVENGDGERLSITVKTNPHREREDVAEIMQAQLAEVGVELLLEIVEWQTLGGQITSTERDFDGVLLAFASEFRLDDSDLFRSDRSDGLYAFAGTDDPELDRALDAVTTAVSREEGIETLQAYQRVLADVHPFTYLYFPDRLEGINRRVQDVVMDVRGEWVSVADWWIAEDQRN